MQQLVGWLSLAPLGYCEKYGPRVREWSRETAGTIEDGLCTRCKIPVQRSVKI